MFMLEFYVMVPSYTPRPVAFVARLRSPVTGVSARYTLSFDDSC